MANARDISLKPIEYVQDLMDEFSELKPEIAKTERARNLRRNKDGSYIVNQIVVRIYLAKERSMIVRTIEEVHVIHSNSDSDDADKQVKRHSVTKKYTTNGELEWTRDDDDGKQDEDGNVFHEIMHHGSTAQQTGSKKPAESPRSPDSKVASSSTRYEPRQRHQEEQRFDLPSYEYANSEAGKRSAAESPSNEVRFNGTTDEPRDSYNYERDSDFHRNIPNNLGDSWGSGRQSYVSTTNNTQSGLPGRTTMTTRRNFTSYR